MITIPTEQKQIDKEKNIAVLIKNRHGVEMVIDLYTAKRLAKNNECEILDENFSTKQEKQKQPKETKTKQTTETPKGEAEKTE